MKLKSAVLLATLTLAATVASAAKPGREQE